MIITLLLEKKENKRSVPSKSSLESVRLAVLRGELPDDAKTIRQMIEAEHSPSDTIAPDLPGQDQEEVTRNPKIKPVHSTHYTISAGTLGCFLMIFALAYSSGSFDG